VVAAGRTAGAVVAMSDELKATTERIRRVLGTTNPN